MVGMVAAVAVVVVVVVVVVWMSRVTRSASERMPGYGRAVI